MEKEKDLNELVQRLQAAAGSNLKSVVLYGSAASGEFNPKHSDLNVLCVLERLRPAELRQLNPVANWWGRKGHPLPLVFRHEDLASSADVFAIELLDIKRSRKVLMGEDVFAHLEVPLELHRIQLERELRTNLIRLRQQYMAAPGDDRSVLKLMTESVSSFAALFRHALVALGQCEPGQVPHRKREVIAKLRECMGLDARGFDTALDVREGKKKPADVDVAPAFAAFLDAIERVTQEVDIRLG